MLGIIILRHCKNTVVNIDTYFQASLSPTPLLYM